MADSAGSKDAVIVRALDPAPMNAEGIEYASAAYEEMERYFNRVVDARRARPGNDLVSLLLTVEEPVTGSR